VPSILLSLLVSTGCMPALEDASETPELDRFADADGDGFAVADHDCDDDDPSIHPSADELCDGVDNDCDGAIDDGDDDVVVDALRWPDADLDGYGEAGTEADWICGAANADDCDDTDAAVHPDAEEVCDDRGVDEDCNGLVDAEDFAAEDVTWYLDYDGDGYGTPEVSVELCEAPDNYVEDATDCDDDARDLNPAQGCYSGDWTGNFSATFATTFAGFDVSDTCNADIDLTIEDDAVVHGGTECVFSGTLLAATFVLVVEGELENGKLYGSLSDTSQGVYIPWTGEVEGDDLVGQFEDSLSYWGMDFAVTGEMSLTRD